MRGFLQKSWKLFGVLSILFNLQKVLRSEKGCETLLYYNFFAGVNKVLRFQPNPLNTSVNKQWYHGIVWQMKGSLGIDIFIFSRYYLRIFFLWLYGCSWSSVYSYDQRWSHWPIQFWQNLDSNRYYAFSLHLLISRCFNIMKPFLASIKTMLTQ